MGFYNDMQKIATDLLTQFDQGGLQYVRRVKTTPNGPDPGVITPTTITLHGAANGVSKQYIGSSLADGTLIVVSDLMATVSVKDFSFEPSLADVVKVNGVSHNIIQVLKVPPAGTPVVYKLFFRKG